MTTFTGPGGTTFHYTEDFATVAVDVVPSEIASRTVAQLGEDRQVDQSYTITLRGGDLLALVAEYVRTQQLEQLKRGAPREVLGLPEEEEKPDECDPAY